MEERQELWLETTKRIIEDSKMSLKKIAEVANVSEQTVARLASGDLSKNKNTGLPTIMKVVAACGGTLSIGGSGSRIIGEELINLQGDVERLTNELNIAMNELDALRKEHTTLMAEADLLRLKLEHKEEIISHKEKIITVYGHLDKLLRRED
jgi:transcriptional regulator with XRE-family HTH domain